MQATIRKTEKFGWIVRVNGEDVFQHVERKACAAFCEKRGLKVVRA